MVRSGATRFPANVRGVYVDGEAVDPIPLLAAFHKPVGTHSTMRDPMHRENLGELALEWPFLKVRPHSYMFPLPHYTHIYIYFRIYF